MLEQIFAVTSMNLRALPQRMAASLVAVIGIAGVVLILVAVLSVSQGFRRTLELAGSDRVAVVLRGSSTGEMESSLSEEQIEIIEQAPGIAHDGRTPIASAELFTSVDQPKRSNGANGVLSNAPLRGLEPAGTRVRKRFRLLEGRMFTPGRYEVIVGRAAAYTLSGLEVGRTVQWATTSGGWSACSPTTAASPNPRSGPTQECCKGPTREATPFRACAHCSSRQRASVPSRTS